MNDRSNNATLLETAASTASSVASEFSATMDSANELARAAVKLADQRVRERPWQTAMLAGGLGVLIGLALRGR